MNLANYTVLTPITQPPAAYLALVQANSSYLAAGTSAAAFLVHRQLLLLPTPLCVALKVFDEL